MAEDHTAERSSAGNDGYGQHQKLYHWVYVVAPWLLTAIVDFLFLWPENHFLALLVFAGATSTVIIYEMAVYGFARQWIELSIIGTFVAALVAYYMIGPVRIPETTITGALQPANDPAPKTACDPSFSEPVPRQFPMAGGLIGIGIKPTAPPPDDAVIAALGKSGVIITSADKVPLVVIKACTLLSIQKTSDGLLVDASVYDSGGKLITRINNNNFTAIEGDNSHVTRRGDLSTLVVSEGNEERLWVHFANPKTVQVRGIFKCPQAQTTITISDDMMLLILNLFPNAPPVGMAFTHACTTNEAIGTANY